MIFVSTEGAVLREVREFDSCVEIAFNGGSMTVLPEDAEKLAEALLAGARKIRENSGEAVSEGVFSVGMQKALAMAPPPIHLTPGFSGNPGLVILAALRGPDSDDTGLKVAFTAPIRQWALTESGYRKSGYYPSYDQIPYRIRTFEDVKAMREAVGGVCSTHFAVHIRMALDAICYVEGWKEEK